MVCRHMSRLTNHPPLIPSREIFLRLAYLIGMICVFLKNPVRDPSFAVAYVLHIRTLTVQTLFSYPSKNAYWYVRNCAFGISFVSLKTRILE